MMKLALLLVLARAHQATGFGFVNIVHRRNLAASLQSKRTDADDSEHSRRSFFKSGAFVAGSVLATTQPLVSWAGIDVTGLQVDGGGGITSNPDIAQQLKAYDGSGSARVRDIQSLQPPKEARATTPVMKTESDTTSLDDPQDPVATWAYRANPGYKPQLTRAGSLGLLYRYQDSVEGPSSMKGRSIGVQFEFPNDWLQLDRAIGGIQWVDQRNGDKVYVFRAPLPVENDKVVPLDEVSKQAIGDWIFNAKSSLVKTGQNIEDYKVTRSQILSDCPKGSCATRRRLLIKYATVTGNGLRVERRALVDAYQVGEKDVYLLMTTSNAIKFDKKDSAERETAENMANSFQIDI